MRQYDILLVRLDPTIGREIQKTRPCVLLSPDEMNGAIGTVIVAPMTTKAHQFPTRITVTLDGTIGYIAIDQIRTIDKSRIVKTIGAIDAKTINSVKAIIKEALVD